MRLSPSEARKHVLQGNLDGSILRRPEPVVEPVKPVPAPDPMTGIADVVMQSVKAQTDISAAMMEALKSVAPKDTKTVKEWKFRVTERDSNGNIVAFSATPSI